MATIPQITATEEPDGLSGEKAAPPLYFELSTNPDPVRVSPSSGDPERADFVLVGSRRSTLAIDCRKVIVNVSTGNNSPDLTPDLNSVNAQISLAGWTATTNTTAKTITFTPTSGHATIGPAQGITIQLMGMRINTVVGSSPLRIDVEWAESGDDYWTTDSTVIDVGKFPPDFVLRNFIPEQLVIDNGGSVKLNWEAGGASSLKLLYDVAEVNVLGRSTYTVNNVRSTTVFYLRATVQVGTGTVERILSTTVTVRVPDLEVRNLKVTGDLTAVTSGTTVRIRDLRGPYGAPLRVNSHLEVLTGNNVSIADNLTVGGDVNATATGRVVRIRDLRGPYGVPLRVNSHLEVLTGNNVSIADNLTVGGKSVLRDQDSVRIRNNNYPENHLNATTAFGTDNSGNFIAAAYWRKNSYDSASTMTLEKR
ncbi:hypothetical protein [Kitasatospora aureofaciens]|uniref:hypothetical protein n=1 Tax=Kitasatospora aureofaciens TaxID=1894 RepID=UPI0033FA3F78